MPQPQSLSREHIGLVICTRDRTTSLLELLSSIAMCNPCPKVAVIVDSNRTSRTADAVAQIQRALPFTLKYLSSASGLPHQRNIGITFLLNSPEATSCDLFAFLDDDVEIAENYFAVLHELFEQFQSTIGVGAANHMYQTCTPQSIALRIALADSRRPGHILRSGFATLPDYSREVGETAWFPGFAMTFRRSVFQRHLFDSELAFYGEDLEFLIRAGTLGQLLVSNRLEVRHKADESDRDSIRDKWSYSDGFRWALSRRTDNQVCSVLVLYSTLFLLVLECIGYSYTRDAQHKLAAKGHLDFFFRLIRGREVQKLRATSVE